MKITRLPPAIPQGSYPGEPWERSGRLYDTAKQWREHEEGGVGGEAHAAYLSGPEEWEKYLLSQSGLLEAIMRHGKEGKD